MSKKAGKSAFIAMGQSWGALGNALSAAPMSRRKWPWWARRAFSEGWLAGNADYRIRMERQGYRFSKFGDMVRWPVGQRPTSVAGKPKAIGIIERKNIW